MTDGIIQAKAPLAVLGLWRLAGIERIILVAAAALYIAAVPVRP